MSEGELSFHSTGDGAVWLTQLEMFELFDRSKQNVSLDINNILSEGELSEDSVVKESLTTAADGKDCRTKVQNKMLWAVIGKTAAELIHARSDADAPNMGQTNWKGAILRKGDVGSAKNCLKPDEVEELNRIVVMYLDHAEDQARRRRAVTMAEWADKPDVFLPFNDRDVLTHAGRLRMDVAQKRAVECYGVFDANRTKAEALAADEADIAELEEMERATKERDKGDEDA